MKTIKNILSLVAIFAMTLSALAQTTSLKTNEVRIEMSYEDGQLNIEWSTQKEVNSSYFLVEKSTDSVHFTAVNMISAAGNSNFVRHYQYTETDNTIAKAYYRVTLVTMNGQLIASAPVPTILVNTGNIAGK